MYKNGNECKHKFNPLIPEFSIVIIIHYKTDSRLVVDEDDLKWVKIKENCHVLVTQFHGNFYSKTPSSRKTSLFSGM